MEFLNNVPYAVAAAFVSFVGSWAVSRQQIRDLKAKVVLLEAALVESNKAGLLALLKHAESNILDFEKVDNRREELKDTFTKQIHSIDNKLTEIHTIVTKL